MKKNNRFKKKYFSDKKIILDEKKELPSLPFRNPEFRDDIYIDSRGFTFFINGFIVR